MKLKLFLILVLVVAGGGAIFVSMGGLAANAPATTYLTSEATVGDVSDDIAATGAIETVASYGLTFGSAAHLVDDGSSADAGAGATWPVESVDVAVGDTVTKGDPLATASATDLQSDLNGAIASRRSAALQLEIAQEQLDDASDTDETRQAKLSLYQAQAQLVQAEATQHDLEAQIAAATLVAPIDGVVTAVNIVVGLDAPSGDAIVIDAATYDVTADVVESDISSISVGQPATVTIDAIDGDDRRHGVGHRAGRECGRAAAGSSHTRSRSSSRPAGGPAARHDGRPHDHDGISLGRPDDPGGCSQRRERRLRRPGPRTQTAPPKSVRSTVGLVTSALAEVKSGLSAGEAVITGTAADRAATTTNQGGGLGGPAGGGGAFPGGGGRFVAP